MIKLLARNAISMQMLNERLKMTRLFALITHFISSHFLKKKKKKSARFVRPRARLRIKIFLIRVDI